MKRLALILSILALSLYSHGQDQVEQGFFSSTPFKLAIDTLNPVVLGDSCTTASTFYLFDSRIVSGAAVLSNGSSINKVAQLFDTGSDSIVIGSIISEIVYVKKDSGIGQFVAGIFPESNLQTPLAQSLPVAGNLLSDTSGTTFFNDFFFSNPVGVKGKFWVVVNVADMGDSIYLASTNDDCGDGKAIFFDGTDWSKFQDQFVLNNNDPLDIALKISVVMEPVVGQHEVSTEKMNIELIPNPANTALRVHFSLPDKPVRLSILSTSGLLLYEEMDYHTGDEINIEFLPRGLYQLLLEDGQIRRVKSLVIRN